MGTAGLNNKNLFPHSSGGWKSKIKELAGLVSPEASVTGCTVWKTVRKSLRAARVATIRCIY